MPTKINFFTKYLCLIFIKYNIICILYFIYFPGYAIILFAKKEEIKVNAIPKPTISEISADFLYFIMPN